MSFSFLDIFKNSFRHVYYKKYRDDINIWEEKVLIFWFVFAIIYYKYSIWKKGKTHIRRYPYIKSAKTAKYFKYIERPFIYKIGKQEFLDRYKNNKWLVPNNCTLDLSVP